MTVDDFRQSLTAANPRAELTLALVGLWWDGKGDWTRAHESAQQDEGVKGSWVHAYLHRNAVRNTQELLLDPNWTQICGCRRCGATLSILPKLGWFARQPGAIREQWF
jgi:hypothetical protein